MSAKNQPIIGWQTWIACTVIMLLLPACNLQPTGPLPVKPDFSTSTLTVTATISPPRLSATEVLVLPSSEAPRLETPTQPEPSPSAQPIQTPGAQTGEGNQVSCTLDLIQNSHDCNLGVSLVPVTPQANGQAVVKIDLSDYAKVRFDITYNATPSEWSVNIGDSASNNGWAGDGSTQSNDAELQIFNQGLAVYASDYGASEQLLVMPAFAQNGKTISFTISNGLLEFVSADGQPGQLQSAYLFALAGQNDDEGAINDDIYAAFNRAIGSDDRSGAGVSQVKITLIPK